MGLATVFVTSPPTAGSRWENKRMALSRLICTKSLASPWRFAVGRPPGSGIPAWAVRQSSSASASGRLGGKTTEVRRLLDLAKPEKYRIIGAVGLLLASSAITMAVPFALGKVIDIIYSGDREEMKGKLRDMTLLLVGVFAAGAVFNFGRTYLMHIAAQRITQGMRSKVYKQIIRQEVAFFDLNKTGELANRLSADTSLVSQCITSNVSDGLRSTALVVAGVSMMVYMSPQLALVGLSIVPPVAILSAGYGRYVKGISKNVQSSLADAAVVAEERIANIRTVRAFGKEVHEFGRYDDSMARVMQLAYKEATAKGTFFALTGFSGNAIILSVLYYGGMMVNESSLTAGQLSSFLLYAAYVTVSLAGISSSYSELMKGVGASTRLWQLIDKQPLIPIAGGQTIPETQFQGKVTFDGVSFSYPTRPDVAILNGLQLEVAPASITAVVGSSGSGKSTLAALLLRFYDPLQGRVLVDGRSVDELDPQWLRANIGVVSQEPTLFSCSVRDNILYGAADDCTEEQVVQAAVEANAWSFIQQWPQGLNTIVGERGVLLSGGQKQRIAIARAIVKNPRILLLDEATSALDSESESLVQEALERVMKGRTVLTIAHRLSTIRSANQIAVLDKGRVVELGTYEHLMEIPQGVFRKLVERQTL